MTAVRVASLLPAATEMVAALGARDRLVGISHECDHPDGLEGIPRLTWSPVDVGASGERIDRQVRELAAAGQPVIAVDGEALRAARPDLILTQDLCDVCAVIDGDVRSLAAALDHQPVLLPLRARDLPGILADIEAVGAGLGLEAAATELVAAARATIATVAAQPSSRPRVVVVEWLDPLFIAGHWVPEMVAAAGGLDVGATPGQHSVVRPWSEVADLRPDVVIVALCGFGIDRARVEWERFLSLPAGAVARGLGARVALLDGNGYTSRPGPRVVEGIVRIANLLRSTG